MAVSENQPADRGETARARMREIEIFKAIEIRIGFYTRPMYGRFAYLP